MQRDAGYGGRVPGLLLRTHTALRMATDLVTEGGEARREGRLTSLAKSLGGLRGDVEDLTSAALGAPPPEGERQAVLAALSVRGDVDRIAVLIGEAGDIARQRGPAPVAKAVRAPLRELGEACLHVVAQAHDVVELSGPAGVLDRDMADVAARRRSLTRLLLARDTECPVRDAAHAMVLGRCLEECAWRATALAGVVVRLREAAVR
ncbi:hypothetical protein [Streptomyces tagetis]|uniref:PhoU domain-containing protein n=1 Tax=Streptomyces tagetis TaxID=2820809 RepID=A0A940XIE1_9ACTN|nr:hypothetical protein [Streptomyces sp. RG38]MBQ0825125.1 hypothetical protein [Streptomyces sp. RG38]